MPVNSTLASFSDFSFKVTFAFYVLGLAVMLAYYVREQLLQEAFRETESYAESAEASGATEATEAKELVGVAAAGASEGGSTGVATPAEESAKTSAAPKAGSKKGKKSGSAPLSVEELHARQDSVDRLGTIGQAIIFIGLIFHAACVVLRGLSAHRFPWGNLYEYVAVCTLAAVIVATIILSRKENRVLWPWVLTPIIALLFYGGMKLYAASAPVVPALQSYWFPIHVSVVSIGAGFGLISGMCSLVYILRMAQPKGKEHGVLGKIIAPLPSAKKLDRMAYRTAVVALPVFGLGVLFGAIWAESAWGRFWGWDPKETISFVTWVCYAAYLHARATSGWRNQKAALINIFAFALMVFNLFFINLVISGLHSYAGLN